MSAIYVGNQLVKSPEQFQKLISEMLWEKPVMVTRFVSVAKMVGRLAAYSVMWQEDQPLLGLDQAVSLRQVLEDICGMLDLPDEERIFILGTQLKLPEVK